MAVIAQAWTKSSPASRDAVRSMLLRGGASKYSAARLMSIPIRSAFSIARRAIVSDRKL